MKNEINRLGASYPTPQLFIDGQWLGSEGRVTEEVLNPATGDVLALLPHASQRDLEAAVKGAKAAFAGWRATSPQERSRMLRAAAVLLRERVDDIAQTMTLEQGKPLREARLELLAAADTFDWYAEEGRRNYGRVVPGRKLTQRITVLHEPVGVCAAFTPWNFPVVTPARKIAGALAAGCTLVLKLAEETPCCGLALVRALHDVGLPAGVLQAVFGVPAQVSSFLLDHPLIAKFSFTGSSAVGKLLAQQAAKTLKRATMELGGHAPAIVCADANVAQAADMLVAGKFRNAGQICIAPTRFYVHRSVYVDFVQAFVEHTRKIVPGNGLDAACGMGPMANSRRLEAMRGLIADAVQRGAKVECGGQAMEGPGFFWQPTVLTGVPEDARLMNEEPFGPLALINPVDSVEEAIIRSNRLPYGLASYAFTQDSATRMQLARGLETGMLGINSLMVSMPEAPFGGVKESGWGSECGVEGLQAYCDVKLISED